MPNGKRSCFACGKTTAKGKDRIVLYRFPKEIENYNKWKEFCSFFVNVREEDNFANYYLCSQHFDSNDESTTNKEKKYVQNPSSASEALSGIDPDITPENILVEVDVYDLEVEDWEDIENTENDLGDK